MSESKHEVSQTEGVARGGKKAALKNHCKRFWWLHLIIFICISVMVICLVIFVGVKNIAQDKINDANLQIQGVNILNSEPDSFTMQVNSTITTDGTVHANVDPFLGNLTLPDIPNSRPFVQLNFPKTNANKFQEVNITQNINISDMEAFEQFNVAFFQNETLRVAVDGKTKIQPAGLSKKYDVDFHKVVTFKGLNKFNGTTLTDMNVNLNATKGEPNFEATATITNPSYYTIDLGNATFANFAADQPLGNLTINNFILKPGSNTLSVSAVLDQTVILGLITKKPYCETGALPVQLLGTDVEKNGQKIPWLLAALSSANQTVELQISDIYKAVGLPLIGCT